MNVEYTFGGTVFSVRSYFFYAIKASIYAAATVFLINAVAAVPTLRSFVSGDYLAYLAKMSLFRGCILAISEHFPRKGWHFFVACMIAFPTATQFEFLIRTATNPTSWGLTIPWTGLAMIAVLEAGFGGVYALIRILGGRLIQAIAETEGAKRLRRQIPYFHDASAG